MIFEQHRPSGEWQCYRYLTCGFGHTAFPSGVMAFMAEVLSFCTARGIPCTVYVDDWFVVCDTRASG